MYTLLYVQFLNTKGRNLKCNTLGIYKDDINSILREKNHPKMLKDINKIQKQHNPLNLDLWPREKTIENRPHKTIQYRTRPHKQIQYHDICHKR